MESGDCAASQRVCRCVRYFFLCGTGSQGVLLLFVRYINTCVCFMSSSQVVKIIVGFGSRIGTLVVERFIAYDISRVCVWVCDGFKTQLHLLRVYRVPFFGGRGPNWPGRGHTTALFPGPSSEHPAVWGRAPDWSSNIEYDRGRAAGGNAVERASSRLPPLSRWSRRRRGGPHPRRPRVPGSLVTFEVW